LTGLHPDLTSSLGLSARYFSREGEPSESIQNAGEGADVVTDEKWKSLRDKAVGVLAHAYAPYSRFPVGAAALADDGRILVGCNVENVSYGLGLCAECSVVCALHSSGGGRLVALSCVDAGGELLMPCGRCRQVLLEHGGPGLLIDHPSGPRPLSELLPDAFGPDDLRRVARKDQIQ
jgi:cytidine deaminase